MRIPHPPSSLSPGQIVAYAATGLVVTATVATAAVLVPPVGLLVLALIVGASLAALIWFSVALYNEHADRRTQRQRLKPGELLQIRRDDNTIVLIDPSRAAAPALIVSEASIQPALPVDEAQQARNMQSAAVQLAQAAPQTRSNWEGIISQRQPPAQINRPAAPTPILPAAEAPAPQLAAPVDLARLRVDLTERMGGDANALLLGVDQRGQEVRAQLHDLMHTGMLAATGGGKTTTMGALGLQLAADPSVQLVVADPHMMELSLLEDTGALHYPMPQNARQAVEQLAALAQEIHRRAELVNQVSTQVKALKGRREILHRLDRYNTAARAVRAEQLPAIVAFGDEIPAMAAMGPEAEQALRTITSEGRKFGVYFIGASQSWKASVISTDVRSQFWSRMILPGAPVRQVAELFEIEQAEARLLTDQLTAPGIAALWRRGGGITMLKTPYIDLESDRVYRVIEEIATQRRQAEWDRELLTELIHQQGENAPEIVLESGPESRETFRSFPESFRPAESEFPGWESGLSTVSASAPIDAEIRGKVLEMRDEGKGKLEIIRALWGASSGRRYQAASVEYDAILQSVE